jgi:Rrf2 family protein
MISQTVEYALRATVYLADQNNEPRTAQQIAEVTKVPVAYLAKVMQGLVRRNIVRSQRGLGGGFALLRAASELTIWDVADAVEPFRRIRECPLGLEAHRLRLCPLHRRLDEALASIERAFRDTTIADVLGEPARNRPPCAFPRLTATRTHESRERAPKRIGR